MNKVQKEKDKLAKKEADLKRSRKINRSLKRRAPTRPGTPSSKRSADDHSDSETMDAEMIESRPHKRSKTGNDEGEEKELVVDNTDTGRSQSVTDSETIDDTRNVASSKGVAGKRKREAKSGSEKSEETEEQSSEDFGVIVHDK